ncbi:MULTISPECIES: hypothetical protein [Mycobacteriaceae]|uniref:Uncharacterized protein n=2 Tax=Mycolicibacterium fortuitum TaxID=1766 RepID=A0AAE4VF89_MYCFO|nr:MULTISPECIES: hypothetical protein [Mycobacteriaceae]ALM19066.1 hypothetical protein AOY11_25095 [Mycobacteroides abscessus]AMU49395.1 hypothetical protein A3O01_03970 [Mycobacteroides abscessus]ANO08067.1 hypothetical protein BAB76_03970 [Mycobacteroides abscessus]MCV7143597.1 hypothetical protein [Mycolicibacterium fortuitum]MDM3921129.1 hypothetical protein [Mycobacteroides abscessus]
MNANYLDTENRWADRQLPEVKGKGVVVISAWTTDAEIAATAEWISAVYGNRNDLDTALRLFRTELRAAVLAIADADEHA